MTRGIVSEAARFLSLGLFSYSFGIGLAAVFRELVGLRPEAAVALSLAILVVTNFWLARKWVFRASGRVDQQLARFVLASAAMRAGEYILFLLLLRLASAYYLLSLTMAMGVSTCVKFIVYRGLVFSSGSSKRIGVRGAEQSTPPTLQ